MGKVNKKEEIKDVQPIRSLDGIQNMKWALRRYCSERDYILFTLGINTGLRVNELLELKIKTVKGKKKIKVPVSKVREGKPPKFRMLYINGAMYDELNAYIKTLEGTEWLFPTTKGNQILDQHISRIQAYRALNKAAEWAELDAIGTHTMRKTFGYWHYKQFKDVAELQTILNHNKPEVTLRYIGITEEQIENNLMNFSL